VLDKEIYMLNYGSVEESTLNLETKAGMELTGSFELFQNVPNPFDKNTTLGFNLPEDDNIQLRIYDYTGRVVYQVNQWFKKGYNELQISTDDLSATGILYYQLDSKSNSASKKMIVIK
jgi:hypothetical protein